MKTTKLSSITGHRAFNIHKPSECWPIADQLVGVEIELEGYSREELRAHEDRGYPFWAVKEDGSLRRGIELALHEPLMGRQLMDAVDYFYASFTHMNPSPRTSIHVHINMRQDTDTVESLQNLTTLYYMWEDAFFRFADESRKWCSYCNPLEDNPPEFIVDLVQGANSRTLHNSLTRLASRNTNRYYGFNAAALRRYGTIEFRHMPLTPDKQRLIQWMSMLMELKLAANTLTNEGVLVPDKIKGPQDTGIIRQLMPRFGDYFMEVVPPAEAYNRLSRLLSFISPPAEVLLNPEHPVIARFTRKAGIQANIGVPLTEHTLLLEGNRIRVMDDVGVVGEFSLFDDNALIEYLARGSITRNEVTAIRGLRYAEEDRRQAAGRQQLEEEHGLADEQAPLPDLPTPPEQEPLTFDIRPALVATRPQTAGAAVNMDFADLFRQHVQRGGGW